MPTFTRSNAAPVACEYGLWSQFALSRFKLSTMIRRLASLLAFVLLAAIVLAWAGATDRSYVFQFLTPAGHLQALGSDRTGLVLFFSDIPFGREMGLSADICAMHGIGRKC